MAEDGEPPSCFLCGRPIGEKVQWHHVVPKSRGPIAGISEGLASSIALCQSDALGDHICGN